MATFVAAVAVLPAVGIVVLMGWRARRADDAAALAQNETDRIRRKLAVLKVAYADGKIDAAEYGERRNELARQLVDLTRNGPVSRARNPRSLLLGAVAIAGIVLGAGLLMWPMPWHSSSGAGLQSPSPVASAAHPLSVEQLERNVVQMRERVKQHPRDATAWAMLAHSYDMLGRHAEASACYAQLIELVPSDPQVLVDAADSMALARGRRLQGEPMQLIQRALALDPKNLKALSLAGTEAFDRADPAQAVDYWQRARAQVTDAALARELDNRIAEARSLQARLASGIAESPASGAVSSAATFVSGRIVLADKLKAQVSPDDALFVFARPVEGSRMPVALMRRRAGELPIEFRLDDSMALVPQTRLSSQPRVIVGARVSKRGDASPKAGDLQGLSAPVALGTQGLRVEITEIVQ